MEDVIHQEPTNIIWRRSRPGRSRERDGTPQRDGIFGSGCSVQERANGRVKELATKVEEPYLSYIPLVTGPI